MKFEMKKQSGVIEVIVHTDPGKKPLAMALDAAKADKFVFVFEDA
jgi:hypothetical protein